MSLDPKTLKALAVRLQDRQIGVISRLAGDRYLFAFDEEYVEDAARPTLSLSFKGRGGALVTTLRSYPTRLPPFFANLLPEGPLRTYLASQAGVKPQREFFLLAALGADLPGAVRVAPIDSHEQPEAAAREEARDPAPDQVLRFSLAGVQLKFSALLEATGGLTIPTDGTGGSWIVKLPSAHYDAVPENEFAMLELARAVGIAVPETRLVAVSDIAGLPRDAAGLKGHALAVQRFDRGPHGQRIHMEDFAQVFGLFPADKYEHRSYANIAAVLSAETGEKGAEEFVRRLAFSVLIGNGDMHLKNWSLLYPDGRTPALSPAYDFVSTVPYIADESLGLTFGGSRSLKGITRDQIRRFADTARLPAEPVRQAVRDTVERTVDAWGRLEARDVLPGDLRERIGRQIEEAARGTDR